jgi:hypothetical protein
MASGRADRLPPPLPPAERTVGQLVAESIRLYGRHFWRALTLGLSLAVLNQLTAGASLEAQVLLAASVGALLLSAAYVAACHLASGAEPTPRSSAVAFAVGVVTFIPAAFLALVFLLPMLAWLALVGLAVPAAVIERTGLRASLARGVTLARADYVHALGSLATLAITYFIARIPLFFLLQGQAENTLRVALFLADLVVSPILFLGAALLYFDQAARVIESPSPRT